jgi:hypothetical protein
MEIFTGTSASESLLKKTYPSGIPDFNASLSLSVYYPKDKGKLFPSTQVTNMASENCLD